MKRTVVFLLSLFPVLLMAQTHVHVQPKLKLIEGSKNPELIEDTTAFRLYFLSISTPTNATPEHYMIQSSKLDELGLSGPDRLQTLLILSDFRQRHDNLIARFNEYATAAQHRGERVDTTLVKQELTDLINSVRASLKALSTGDIDGKVAHEKKSMKRLTTEGVQQ
jgi:hypothetical protein